MGKSGSKAEANEDDLPCAGCRSPEDGDSMLLCDSTGCERAYHTYCLQPPLYEVPEGDWFCPTCSRWQLEQSLGYAPPNSGQ